MTADARVGILGGTFDPIHLGHIETARAAHRALALDRVVLVPSRLPPHRPGEPMASAFHRFAMAALCASECEWMSVSDLELQAPGPSYTAQTLEHVRDSGIRPSQMFFITGADAFAEIETWHRYPEVLDLANFVVVSRPGMPVNSLRERLPSLAHRFVMDEKGARHVGRGIYLVDATTPNISSTEIRRRLAAGESVHGLLCSGVERHIRRHHLYSAEGVRQYSSGG
jgi:nicotinate-nucleotide adenylyltransferase